MFSDLKSFGTSSAAFAGAMSEFADKTLTKEASRWRALLRAGGLSGAATSKLRQFAKNAPTIAPLSQRLSKFKDLKASGVAPRQAATRAGTPAATPFKPILDPQREARGLARGNKNLMRRHGMTTVKNPLPGNKYFNWKKPTAAHARPGDNALTLGHESATPRSVRLQRMLELDRAHNMSRYGNPFGKEHRFPTIRPDLLTKLYRNPKTGFNKNMDWVHGSKPGEMGSLVDLRTPSQRVFQRGAQKVDNLVNSWAHRLQRSTRPARHAVADARMGLSRLMNRNAPPQRSATRSPPAAKDRFPKDAYVGGKLMPKPARAGDVAGTARHEVNELIKSKQLSQNNPVYFTHVSPSVLQREAGHVNFMHPAAQEKTLRMRARSGELQNFADTVAGRPSTGVSPGSAAAEKMTPKELRELAKPYLQSNRLSPSDRKRLTEKLQENYDSYWSPAARAGK